VVVKATTLPSADIPPKVAGDAAEAGAGAQKAVALTTESSSGRRGLRSIRSVIGGGR